MKVSDNSNSSTDVPLRIQSFLWRQTDPIVRHQNQKSSNYDEVCTALHAIFVENKLQDFPPTLSDAVDTIPRWQLVNAALPYIMHCSAIALTDRHTLGEADKLGVSTVKLFKTLHWMLLEASEVCGRRNEEQDFLANLDNARLFIHLFAPIANYVKEVDFSKGNNDRGAVIWKPMWKSERPCIPTFESPVTSLREESSQTALWEPQRSMALPIPVTVCDVAVISCLLYHRWCDDGVLWAITYLNKKLQSCLKRNQSGVKLHNRRCNSLVERRMKTSTLKSIAHLPCQRECFCETKLEEISAPSVPAIEFEPKEGPRIQKKIFNFRSKSSTGINKIKKTKSSPIATRRNRIRSFARISATKIRAKNFKKLIQMKEDLPPPYKVATAGGNPAQIRKEFRRSNAVDGSSSSSTTTDSDVETSFPVLPPHYTHADPDDKDEVFYSSNTSDRPSTSGLSKHRKTSTDASGSAMEENSKMKRRWISDTCLTYAKNKMAPATMTSNKFVDENDNLHTDVILAAVDAVVAKKPNFRILENCLQVLTFVYDREQLVKAKRMKTAKMFLKVLYNLTRILGCSNACSKQGHRNIKNERMRLKTRHLIVSLFKTQRSNFEKHIATFPRTQSLREIMEFLHNLLSYCSVNVNTAIVKELNDEALFMDSQTGNKLEDVVMKMTFRDVISKCVRSSNTLAKPENKDLYSEVRNYIQFVRLNNPSTFNEVLLTIMLVPARKRRKWQEGRISSKSSVVDNSEEFKQNLGGIRKKRRGAVELDQCPLLAQLNVVDKSKSAAEGIRRNSSWKKTENLLLQQRTWPPPNRGPGPILQLLLLPECLCQLDDSSSRNVNFVDLKANINPIWMKKFFKKSKVYKRFRHYQRRKRASIKDPCLRLATTFSSQFFPIIKMAENPNKANKLEFEVAPSDIYKGVEILQFLMESCPPGTVPDAAVLGSVMGLKSPVICRFVVLLQCAHFVDRYMNGLWPRWIKDHEKTVKEHYYTTSRIQFFRWAVEINKFLEKIIAVSSDPSKVLGDVTNEEDQLRNRNEDLNEDFLKDIKVNPSGKDCPVALQMAASDLLFRITTYLKDTTFEQLRLRSEQPPPKKPRITTEHGSKQDLPNAAASKSDEVSTKKTIKFQGAPDAPHLTSSPSSGTSLKRAASSVESQPERVPVPEMRRSSSGANGSDESRSSVTTSQPLGARKASMHTSSNTLTVPVGGFFGSGEGSTFGSCKNVSYGSTISVSSATSEYVKDISEAMLSPNAVFSNSPSFIFGSVQTLDAVTRSKDLPWMKSMIQLANQQNFLCGHKYFCHPFCNKRMIRSCNRLVETLNEIFSRFEAKEEKLIFMDLDQSEKIQLSSYLKTEAQCLARSPLLVLLGAVTSLTIEMLVDLHALCWELLLDSDKLLAEVAAALFLLCAIKVRAVVHSSVMAELKHKDPVQRINTLRKIRILWEYRKTVWNYAENQARENRETGFTFPAANTSFAVSLSGLGLGSSAIPDPPWLPHIVNVDKMVAQKGSLTKSAAILTTDSLSYEKEQELKQLLRQEREERAEARKNYSFTDVPVLQHVTSAAKKKIDINEDDGLGEIRRFSSRPVISSSNQSTSDFRKENPRSARPSLIHGTLRASHADNSNNEVPRPNSSVFPPSIGDCVPTMIQMIEDVATTPQNQSVGNIAHRVVISCLQEDANLFIRSIAENLLNNTEQFKALWILRKLPSLISELGPAVAHQFFNQIIECVIQYNRAPPKPNVRERIAAPSTFAMAAILPFVEGIDLKVLKQTLRKEQIDMQLIITAGMKGTKKVTVWTEGNFYVPNQLEVDDRSTFAHVLQDAVNANDVPQLEHHLYSLVDNNNDQLLCLHCYVRDFFAFHKTAYPEITLIKTAPEKNERKLCERVIELKLAEIGRLHFTIEGLRGQKHLADKELNATYLQDEFKRLWSFPRKAMDAEYFLFESKYGKEVRCLDVIQKYCWVELISAIMLSLPSEFPWENDLIFFLHVWNSALVVHCHHTPLLRRIMAAVVDAVVHFSRTFTQRGYSLILPSMLIVYSEHFKSDTIRRCLDFAFFQMLDVHRHPFLLQLFASAAPLLSKHNQHVSSGGETREKFISPSDFFNLLLALSKKDIQDEFHIMNLVKAEKPLKPADTCLETDPVSIQFSDYFRLCVTIIAYQPENGRISEMLIILNNLLPCYFQHIRLHRKPAEELSLIHGVAVHIRFLLSNVECLTKSMSTHSPPQQGQQQPQSNHSSWRTMLKSQQNGSKKRSDFKIEEGQGKDEIKEKRQMIEEFVTPRDILLQLCTTFYVTATSRVNSLKKPSSEDLLGAKCHFRLAEVAQSLLKLLTDESIPSVSFGLAFFVEHMLPTVDWSVESARPALFVVIKRLDRFFGKISKVYSYRKSMDWRTVTMMINGVCTLLARQPIVAHIPHLKGFVHLNVSMQMGSALTSNDASTQRQCSGKSNLSTALTQRVMKLIVLQIQGNARDTSIEEVLASLFQTEKRNDVLLNIVIPVCLCTAADLPPDALCDNEAKKVKLSMHLSKSDVLYLVKLCTNALKGKTKQTSALISHVISSASPIMEQNNITNYKVVCLALKVLITCFHRQLKGEWHELAKTLEETMYLYITGPAVWKFVVFLMRHKTPLLSFLKTFVVRKFMQRQVLSIEEMEQKQILEDILKNRKHRSIKLSLMIHEFVEEAQELRKELQNRTLSHAYTPKLSLCVPMSANASSDIQEGDRSRKASFRKAVTPTSSRESVVIIAEGNKREQRTSMSSTRLHPAKSTMSMAQLVAKEKMQTCQSISGEFKEPNIVPDIRIDKYDTPLSSPCVLRNTNLAGELISSRFQSSSQNSDLKEKEKRASVSGVATLLDLPDSDHLS